MYLIIDSAALGAEDASDFTLYLSHKIPSHLTKVGLRSFVMRHGIDVTKLFFNKESYKNIYIHCDILGKDDNFYNGRKSDVLALGICKNITFKKVIFNTCGTCSYKDLKSTNFTSIRMYLCESDGAPLKPTGPSEVTYELEFI